MISHFLLSDFLAGYICAATFYRCDQWKMHWAKRNLAAIGIMTGLMLAAHLIGDLLVKVDL